MKNFKKLMALVIAAVMVIGSLSLTAFADQGAASADGSVTISGLEEGDKVSLYKVIGWSDSTGWVLENGYTVAAFDGKLGVNNQAVSIDTAVINDITDDLGTAYTNASVQGSVIQEDIPIGTDKTYTATVEPGMYIAIVTAGTPGIIYNPIIVSSDFVTGGNSIDASADTSVIPGSPDASKAVAKKSTITLEKEGTDAQTHDANNQETVAVGDVMTFTIDTQIPPFKTYVKPIFKISDKLSDGIDLVADTNRTSGYNINVVAPTGLTENTDYTITATDAHNFIVEFTENYLKSVVANTDVQIQYTATITSDAIQSVNPENNTVTLEYQRDPKSDSDETTEKVRDITNHYSFTIDGNLLGNRNYSASEVVKVGVSADGSEILETIELANGNEVGALQGAHFALYAVSDDEYNAALPTAATPTFDATGKTPYSNKDSEGTVVSYDDITSGPDGRINIKGIDAGKYVLIETSAPNGYIKRQTPITIWIDPTVETKEYDMVDPDGTKVHIKTKELVSYKVIVDGVETADYTITNSSNVVNTSSDEADVAGEGDKGKIKNTKGVELPSTGGMGTTLFYAIGAILVLGAGILLVSKRRMAAN